MNKTTIYQAKGMLINSENGLPIIDFDIIKGKYTAKKDETELFVNIKSKDLDKLNANKHILEFVVVRILTATQLLVNIKFSSNSDVAFFTTTSFPPIFKNSEKYLLKDHIIIHQDENEKHQLKTADMIVFKEYQMLENPNITLYWFYVPTEQQSEIMKQIELISSIPNLQSKIISAGTYGIDNTVQLFTIEVEQ